MKKIFIIAFLLTSTFNSIIFADDASVNKDKAEAITNEAIANPKVDVNVDIAKTDNKSEPKLESKELKSTPINLEQIIATYNFDGKKIEIKEKEIADLVEKQSGKKYADLSESEREQLKPAMVIGMLIVKDAEKNNLSSHEDITKKLEMVKQELLIQKIISDYIEKNFKESLVDDLYNERKEAFKDRKAFDIQIIPVEDEAKAEKTLKDINKAQNKKTEFNKVLKEVTKALGNNVTAAQMTIKNASVPAQVITQDFEDQLLQIKKGSIGLVKHMNNFFIVHLMDVKKAVLESKDKIKNDLTNEVKKKLIMEYREKLTKDFDLQIVSNINSDKLTSN